MSWINTPIIMGGGGLEIKRVLYYYDVPNGAGLWATVTLPTDCIYANCTVSINFKGSSYGEVNLLGYQYTSAANTISVKSNFASAVTFVITEYVEGTFKSIQKGYVSMQYEHPNSYIYGQLAIANIATVEPNKSTVISHCFGRVPTAWSMPGYLNSDGNTLIAGIYKPQNWNGTISWFWNVIESL